VINMAGASTMAGKIAEPSDARHCRAVDLAGDSGAIGPQALSCE
jgi:hypothetical protein